MAEDSHDPQRHETSWALIPWLVNGRLSGDLAATAQAHIESCIPCQREQEAQSRIHRAMQPDDSIAFAAEASFQKLSARLDRRPRERHSPAWLAAACVVAAIALGAGGTWVWRPRPTSSDASYTTLTTPGHLRERGPGMRVVFKSDLTVGELQGVLRSLSAHIVDGPTEAGVYTLGFASPINSAELAQRLAILRADASVRFAEPVTVSAGMTP